MSDRIGTHSIKKKTHEIEKLAEGLFLSGVVRPNTSSYLLVLLLKKHDGSWKLCGLLGPKLADD